jgi:diguanylate cyclase (GGDEF)-like protein/PAS domain S-box-containing protein
MNSKYGLSRFFSRFWLTLGVFLIFSVVFVIYARSEKQIDFANELRYQSRVLADELRQSSDDLTRMVRTYVTTGDRAYKQYYQEIIDIREGRVPRPIDYQDIYWDLVLANGQRPRPGSQAIALLDLMKKVGFTEEEYAKLAQAKAYSDALSKIEIAAMKLVELTTPVSEANRRLASQMLNDAHYHSAKAAIMQPIGEFYQLMDKRTNDRVRRAEYIALRLRITFIFFGLMLFVLLWRAYQALYATLGGDANDLQARLARLGRGDFSSLIPVPAGRADSVMGWLAVTQEKLAEIDAGRQRAIDRGERLTQLYNALSQCNQAIVRSTNEIELFAQICSDTVSFGGMRMAWIGLVDPQTQLLNPVAAFGDGLDYLQDRIISLDENSQLGKGPSGIAARENRPFWCQDFQHDPISEPWHVFGVQFGWAASAALPLHRNGVVIGSFNLYASSVNFFDEEVRRLLTEMAMDIDFAINRFDLEIEQRRSQQLKSMRVFLLERISGTIPLNEIFLDVIRNLEATIQDCFCSILLLDPDGVHLRVGAAPSLPDFYHEAIDGLSIDDGVGSFGNTMYTGLRIIVEDIATHPYWPEFKLLAARAGLSSCWSEPIRSTNGKIVGSFAIYHAKASAPDRIHLELLEMTTYFIAIAIERKQSETALRKLSQAVEQSPNVIIITDANANIEYVNAAFVQSSGKTLPEVIGKKSNVLQSGKNEHFIYDDMWAHLNQGDSWKGELVNKYKDGSEHIDLVHISPVRDEAGIVTHYLSIQEDVTEKKHAEERIEYLAHFDVLTGLPNRVLFDERAKYALGLAKRNQESVAVMFLDLDHFKNINDSLGHKLGDVILIEVAKRLLFSLRENDIVSRLGGDEFILLLPGNNAAGAESAVQKLLLRISDPYQIGQYDLNITASVGIAIFPDDGEELDALSKNADAAMYRAKQEGRNGFSFFTREMQARSMRHLELMNALRHALDRQQLQVVYQPQVSIWDGRVIGAEALLRWQHPQLGAISPTEFIPIAEESGLIFPIGEWVLRTAVQQVKSWHTHGVTSLTMAVNLSAIQFRHRDLPDLVTSILNEAGLPSQYLELELTESVAMFDPQGAIAVMNNLYERGVRMSIDDFGTGYSSLNYLKKFKVYKLKIDQSFVQDIGRDTEDKAIVSAVIAIAKSLGLQTIAEGVETEEQFEFLRKQGCDEIQGYYFSKPLSAAEFEEFIDYL